MNRRSLESLSLIEVQDCLSGPGLYLNMQPFVVHVQSPVPVLAQGLHRMYAQHQCWVEDGDFADFRVRVNPKRQWFKPLCEFQLDGLKPFTPLAIGEAYALFEWGVNWCISGYAHRWVVIHAAVLARDGRAVILPAPPGSGKSTLCAALMAHGWRLLSDELALLDPATGQLTPCPRPISLKNASIGIMQQRLPHVPMGPVAHDTLKGTVAHLQASGASIHGADQLAVPAWIVYPKYRAGADVQIQVRGKPEALVELQRNAFNRHVHGHAGFHALADLVSRCEVYNFEYSRIDEALRCFDELVEVGSWH